MVFNPPLCLFYFYMPWLMCPGLWPYKPLNVLCVLCVCVCLLGSDFLSVFFLALLYCTIPVLLPNTYQTYQPDTLASFCQDSCCCCCRCGSWQLLFLSFCCRSLLLMWRHNYLFTIVGEFFLGLPVGSQETRPKKYKAQRFKVSVANSYFSYSAGTVTIFVVWNR